MWQEHGTALQKEDIYKAYDFGGKMVYFDQSELAKFGTEDGLGDNGLALLGFKDQSKLKLHHNLGPAKCASPPPPRGRHGVSVCTPAGRAVVAGRMRGLTVVDWHGVVHASDFAVLEHTPGRRPTASAGAGALWRPGGPVVAAEA